MADDLKMRVSHVWWFSFSKAAMVDAKDLYQMVYERGDGKWSAVTIKMLMRIEQRSSEATKSMINKVTGGLFNG